MAKLDIRTSIKHLQIDKANARIVIAASITTAVVIFSLVAVQALYKQMAYQNKVIGLRNKANQQLEKNINSTKTLVESYKTFDGSNESVIGTADKNSKIVLDALPSKYDFPALATSLDGLIKGSGAKVDSITGTDNEASAEQDSANPQPVEIPFSISASANSATIQKLLADIERSIRPFQILTINFSGSDTNLQTTITAKTYYQPEKKLTVNPEVVPGPNTTTKKTTKKTVTKETQ
jgi:hypothetical protein